jgi:magnesium-transporting ATPase (P-type)
MVGSMTPSKRPSPQNPGIPEAVTWASIILLALAAIRVGFALLIFTQSRSPVAQRPLTEGEAIVYVTFAVAYVWLVIKIRVGRNWARNVASVVAPLWSSTIELPIVMGMNLVLALIAVYLLWVPWASRAHFVKAKQGAS